MLRDAAWLNWRFVEGPGRYTRLVEEGYAVAGRWRGFGVVAAMAGDLLAMPPRRLAGPLVLAAPPPGERRRYLLGGYVPTPKTFTVIGKSLEASVGGPGAAAPRARRPRLSLSRRAYA